MFTQLVCVSVLFFRFADEVNGEIPEVDCRGRIKRFVSIINFKIIINVPFIPTKN